MTSQMKIKNPQITNISGNILVMSFNLGISDVYQVMYKMKPTVMFPIATLAALLSW